MIDKDSFSKQWIESQKEATTWERMQVVERCIHAFYLLEKLAKSGFPFIFKGGTSLMLLSPAPKRFSVDVDIIADPSLFETIKKISDSLRDDRLYKVEEDIRKPKDVVKRHFKFFYHPVFPSQSSSNAYVLLDVVFERNPYLNIVSREISIPWIKTKEPFFNVSVPSIEEILGDKMTAFAPNTIGKLYSEGRYTEICKQLFDIALLSRIAKDERTIKRSYDAVCKLEIENRSNAFTEKDAIEDSLETLRIILSDGNRKNGEALMPWLRKGHDSLASYFVIDPYGDQSWLCDAAEAYLRYGSMAFRKTLNAPAKNSETFIGRRYALLKRGLGEEKLNQLMIMVNNDPYKSSKR